MRIKEYQKIAKEARKVVLHLIYKAQTSHLGSNFSLIDILTVLFDKINFNYDKIILSKGWAAASLYYFLWKKGKIKESDLNSYCQSGSKFIGLAEPVIPEIPVAGGSMGFGLPFGVGFGLAKKIKKEKGKIYVLMSDGEMDCGTTWESALIASHHHLDNLIVIIDYNGFQAMGRTKEILNIEPLKNKWQAFNWKVIEINGHNFKDIKKNLDLKSKEKPLAIIAKTIKGKGVSFMENNNLYHYKAPSKEEYQKAFKELQ